MHDQLETIIEKPTELSAPRIVCAANQHIATGQVAMGIRHFCPLMVDNILARKKVFEQSCSDPEVISEYDLGWRTSRQGFVDQHGKFYEREAAWIIADRNGQIIRDRDWQTGSLHSEHLY